MKSSFAMSVQPFLLLILNTFIVTGKLSAEFFRRIVAMRMFKTIAILLSVCLGTSEFADAGSVNKDGGSQDIKAGIPTVVWNVWNCLGYPIVVSGTAENGSVTLREARQNRCGKPRQAVGQLVYTSAPGFKGTDHLTVYVGRQSVDVTLNVK